MERAGAPAADGEEGGPTAEAGQAAAHRRDPLADRAGAPWRNVPPCYGPWRSAYGLFRRWQRDGTWKRLLTALQALADAAGHVTWDVSVDSGTARAPARG